MDDSKQLELQAAAKAALKQRQGTSTPHSLDAVFRAMLAPLQESVTRIERRMIHNERVKEGSEGANLDEGRDAVLKAISGQLRPLSSQINQLVDQMTLLLERSAAVEMEPSDDDSLGEHHWEEIVLGQDLCALDSIADLRVQLIEDIVSGKRAAKALAGQLLLIQGVGTTEFPERLQPVGEAYYRWHPRASADGDPFERALADSLTRQAESIGLPNSIRLVRLGERYDETRHATNSRGRDVASVHGWIVLREDHKVYTKANVTLK